MTLLKLIIKSLKYYRKQHLAVFAGTLISTAVLTGALIIGDSVKYSLINIVEKRLGNVRFALQTNDRFVTKEFAANLRKTLHVKSSAAILTHGLASNPEKQKKANNLQILGIDSLFWRFTDNQLNNLSDNECFINKDLAEDLNLKVNDEFILRANNLSEIPVNAPFAEEENTNVSFRVKVKNILTNNQLGSFSLKSNQNPPKNIFISYKFLSDKLDINNLSNLILLTGNENINQKKIESSFSALWQLEDAEISIREIKESNELEIISSRIFIDNPIATAIDKINVQSNKILTYLVNSIQLKGKETPYSFVTAIDEFESHKLQDNEIVVNQWLADDISAEIGDSIDLTYFIIGPMRNLEEQSSSFVVKDIIPLENNEGLKSLMPEFPGITESSSCKEWNTGIPIDLDKIRDKDEDYWDEYKGTPKAFISLKKGTELWANQFGNYTAFRFNKNDVSIAEIEQQILKNLKPKDLGMEFQAVYEKGIHAAKNSVDFAGLFLGMSFFVIIAGILLTVLIYSLNATSRGSETGLLSALGFTRKAIIKIKILETVFITLFASIAGAIVGILYNLGIMAGLNSVWHDIVRTDAISMHIKPMTLVLGIAIGMITSLISIYWVIRKQQKKSIIANIRKSPKTVTLRKNRRINFFLATILIIGALLIVGYSISIGAIDNSGLFLSAGGMFLLGMIFYFNYLLKKHKASNKLSFSILARKNTSRNSGRSIGTISLLALGAFSVLITAANRKTFIGADNNRSSGTGAYTFWAETTTPLLHDLNTNNGKEEYNLQGEELIDVHFNQLHSLSGDDASCLNLNQVQKPQILGVKSRELFERKAFAFVKRLKGTDKNAGWDLLTKDFGENIVPAIADQTVLQWGLMKKVGDTLTYLNEKGDEIHLLLVGGLAASVFQGNLLIDDTQFMKHFPSSGGSKIMLIETPENKANKVKEILENTFIDQGIEITSTTERLSNFYSVTNTYLALFMALGGLGVIIGTIGLGIVIFRNMLDRRQELATLQALGFKKKQIFNLIFKENLFLLFSGLLIGLLSAVIGIMPSLLSPSFAIPGGFVFIVIAIIIASGLLWIYFPTKISMKRNLIEGLREE